MNIVKMRTKLLVIMVFIVALVFSGCGNKEEAVSQKDKGTTKAVTEGNKEEGSEDSKKKELKPVKLVAMYPSRMGSEADQALVDEKINEYLKEKFNCTIERQPFDFATWKQKYPLVLQAGEQIDLLYTDQKFYLNNVGKKAYVPLDDLLDTYGQGIKNVFTPEEIGYNKVDGTLYSIPVNKDHGGARGIFYLKEYIEKYNIDYENIDTYEEMEEALAIIKKNEPQLVPLWLTASSTFASMQALKITEDEDIYNYEDVAGLKWIGLDTTTDKIVFRGDVPSFMERLKYIRRWNQNGYINEDAATTKIDSENATKNGLSWMILSGGKPGIEVLIGGRIGKEIVKGYTSVPLVTSKNFKNVAWTIPVFSKDPERAMMVLNALYEDKEFYNLWVHGIEGKNYIKVDDNTIKLPEGAKSMNDRGYNPAIDWRTGNQFLSYIWEGEATDKWEQFEEYNKSGQNSKLFNFVFLQNSVKTEIAAMNSIIAEFEKPLYTGLLDPEETMVEFKKRLVASGLDKVIAEVQKAYDEWKQQ